MREGKKKQSLREMSEKKRGRSEKMKGERKSE
jgi:hypothetical protein